MVATRPKIVGREREIDALESALDSAKSGNGRAVGLFGEPGIGKTVLVSLASESAERQGFKVIRGYCREHGGAPAYWPWVELIRGLLSGRSDDEAKRLLGENIGWLAQISPDAARFSSSPESKESIRSASSPEEFRFQLFDALSRTLRSASEAEPLLLIIEDIHWADESSLYLLELLASSVGESPIAFIFTSRDFEMADHPTALSRTIGELVRWDVFSKIDLKRLSLEATAEQVVSLGGDGDNRGLRDAIFASSEGNPLFTAELIRLLAQQGKLETATADDVGVSGGVSEVITRRLSNLSDNELDLVQTCSVIGQEIEIGLLASVAETSVQQLLIDLESPISSQILRFEASNFHFTHALVGETVSKGLSAPELVRRNAKVAEALIEFAGENIRPYIQRLAVHYVASQAITGINRAVEYSLLAGEEALRLVEFAPASQHFQQVLELTANKEINSARAQALGGMWKLSSRTAHESEIGGLVPLLVESFDYYLQNGDTERAVDLASWATTPYTSTRGVDEVMGRALELVAPDSLAAGHLFSRKISTAYMERRALKEAEDSFEKAVRIATRYSNKELELIATAAMLSAYGHSESGMTDDAQNTRGGQSLIMRGVELANDSSNLFFESVLLFRAIVWYTTAGDLQTAWSHMRRAREIDELIKSPNRAATNLSVESALYADEGSWDKSRSSAEEALSIDETAVRPMAVAIRVEYETGNFDRAQDYLDRINSHRTAGPTSHPYVASLQALSLARNFEITGNRSNLAKARSISEPIIEAGAPTGSAERHHREVLMEVAIHSDDLDLAKKHFAPLRKMGYGGDFGFGFERALANGATMLGNFEEAESIFTETLDKRRNAGNGPELAWTCHDYSVFLLRRNHAGDLDNAHLLVDEANKIVNRLGMPPLKAKLESLLDDLLKHAGKASLPAGLSKREVEVLKLVAVGMTNARIADELFISTHTVVRHVSNIMSKTESSSRTEAGLFAERNGLL